MQGGELQPDLISARMREYFATHGRTAEIRRLRDHLEHPGIINSWDPSNGWDPSHLGYSVAVDPLPPHVS
jgi:hypothetical protein